MTKWWIMIMTFLPFVDSFGQGSDWPSRYQDRRFKERWSLEYWSYRDSLARDWSDKIKNVGISKGKSVWMSFGGQLRVRYMGTINENFEDKNSGLFTLRTRLHGDLNLGRRLKVFAEGIYSNTTDDDAERQIGIGAPATSGALLNLFLDAKIIKSDAINADLWLGRRELQWGHERMISPGNWLSTRRSWDGIGLNLNFKKFYLSSFVTRPVIVVPDGFSQRDDETVIWGVRLQSDLIQYGMLNGFGVESWSTHQKWLIEPYYLNIRRKNVTFEQGQADDNRNTFGILVAGPINKGLFDLEFEGMYQWGTFGSSDLNAYSITAEFGYTPRNVVLDPHLWVGFDYSSGDSNPNDTRLETFDPLYAQVSAWFGEHGIMDRKNLVAYSANIDLLPFAFFMVRFTYWNFNRTSAADAVYNTTNGIFRGVNGSTNKDLGDSFQTSITYEPAHHWQFTFTYNFWKPGEFFSETQSTEALTQHFLMVTSQFTF